LAIAIADPSQLMMIDEVGLLLGKRLVTKVATLSQIFDLLKKAEQSQRVLESRERAGKSSHPFSRAVNTCVLIRDERCTLARAASAVRAGAKGRVVGDAAPSRSARAALHHLLARRLWAARSMESRRLD